MEPRQEQQVEEQEEDMFFNAGRAANYAEQYAPSQRLKDTLLKSSSTSNNHHHDDINLQKQLNKQQQQSQSIQQYQTPQIATTTPIRTMNNSNNINNNTNNSSNNSNTAMMNNITNNSPTINRNVPSTTSYNNSSIPATEARLPTLPSLPSSILNSSSSANTASSTSNNEKALPILSSPGVVGVLTSDQKRKISLQYLAEISNFSRKDVQDAMVSKIDNESGEIYGNIPDIVVGMKYSSRMDLLDSKIHTDLQSDICTNGNYIKPVPAVIMHDTQERHEDRGTVVLYSIPFNGHHSDINTAPSIKGTPCEALAQNSIYKIPVRVVRGSYESSVDDGKRFRNGHCPTQGYRYDGIYFVGEYFYEPGASSFVFKLIRIYGQPELPHAPNLSEPPANRNNNQRPPNSQQQGPPTPSNMPNMPNDRKIFGIPSFVTQRILSGSNQDYLAQSTRNSHNMPYIPSLPQNYSHSNNYNSQTNNPQNPHSLPAMPAMPNMNYNRNNFPNNNSNMNNNYNEPPPPQNNRPVMRSNNQSSSQSSFGSQSFPNNNNNTNTNNNTTTGSTNNDGLNLSHTSVRQMINNLKFQNSNFGGRIQSYSYNISELATKVEDVQKTMPALGRQLTSRNKTFTWKLGQQEKEQEEYDRTKYFVYDDEEDGSEDEDVEIERPSRSKKKKTHHIGSSSGNISSGNNSVRTTPNDSNSTNSSSKSNNKQ